MEPILLIHGYSSEGKDNTIGKIYGSLPAELRKLFGRRNVREFNLSRWLSLSDGISLDDVSFAMYRALKQEYRIYLRRVFISLSTALVLWSLVTGLRNSVLNLLSSSTLCI